MNIHFRDVVHHGNGHAAGRRHRLSDSHGDQRLAVNHHDLWVVHLGDLQFYGAAFEHSDDQKEHQACDQAEKIGPNSHEADFI